MKLLSGLAIVAYAQSGDGSAETAIDVPASVEANGLVRSQRAFSSGGNSDYEYYYEQTALGRRKKKKKKKIIFNIPQRPTTTRAPPTTTRAPLPAISNDYNMLFGENGSFGSKVSSDYLDYNGGSAGVAGNSGSDRWSGFGGDFAYNYDDGFGEITVGNTFSNGGKGNFEFNQVYEDTAMVGSLNSNDVNFNEVDNSFGEWNISQNEKRWDNDDINKYWEFMHRQWGHQQENRLSRNFAFKADSSSATALEEPSRWYHVGPERVINNLNRGYLNYQFPAADGKGKPNESHFKFPKDRRAFLQAGRHGHPWGTMPDKEWALQVDAKYSGGDSTGDGGDTGSNKFGWYAQPWLWDAENVKGVSDYKLWNGANYKNRAIVGTVAAADTNSQNAITHTFGFIDWKDANKDSWPTTGETGIIPGDGTTSGVMASDVANGTRFQDVSPARAPWYGRRFDASWELGDSPAHFVFDGVDVHGTGLTIFDKNFAKESVSPTYLERHGVNNTNAQQGWQRYYSGYRWFPGIANFPGLRNAVGSTDQVGGSAANVYPSWARDTPNMHGADAAPETRNQVHDPAKLKCHQCAESASLKWDDKYHTFKLVSAHSITTKHYISEDDLDATEFGTASTVAGDLIADGNDNAHNNGVDLWKQCFDTLQQRSCEYSSGVCFVEERRVWGYVTQVQAGCQQAQACYMQKYQNFVVEAGRQCWPGDAFGESHKLATRPDDMRADQWIYNIIKGGLMLAAKDPVSETNYNDHRLRKFPSHYFSEMENNNLNTISSLEKSTIRDDAKYNVRITGGVATRIDFRENNNWIDKFHTGHSGIVDDNPVANGGSQMARATLTDGNYGVGRSGYESAFSTLLHYPTFMNVGKLNNYIYRGGSDTTDGTANSNPYVTADVAHSNQVYGMKVDDAKIDGYDAANKGQSFNGGDVIPAEGQSNVGGNEDPGEDGDLDFNGQGGADGSMFAERSQFYQNEATRFASSLPIDDQWRNPDQHNYVQNAGTETSPVAASAVPIYRKYGDRSWSAGAPSSTLSQILETPSVTSTEATRYQPIEYKNGLVEASKCHQCCNTDHNCNWNWQPTTKVDWNFAYVWRYQAIDERSNPVGASGAATTSVMGVGENDRGFHNEVTTLSQTIGDHHFNFPPYMANHPINRGNGATDFGDPMGGAAASATTISTAASTYTVNAGSDGGFFDYSTG